MAKKYLSLEEAAARLGVPADELKRLRTQGNLRGYADRGTWKFKQEDVEEYIRRKQADSDPDVPIFGSEKPESMYGEDSAGEMPTDLHDDDLLDAGISDSDVRLVLDDDLIASDSGIGLTVDGDSDSDVRLVEDKRGAKPPIKADSDSDVKIVDSDSDSDVRLAPEEESDSDSDVKIVSGESDSDSDVRLEPDAKPGSKSDSDLQILRADSDSDVRLAPETDMDINLASSDSDVQLVSDSGMLRGGSDSDVGLVMDDDEGLAKTDREISMVPPAESDESGIGLSDSSDEFDLSLAAESGVSLEGSDDSGIALAGDDSGIALDADDSGITIEGVSDSGIALDEAADSGIALEDLDSGISLAAQDSGIALDRRDDLRGTIPEMEVARFDDEESETQHELEAFDAKSPDRADTAGESDFEFAMEDDSNTSVLFFDDDEDGGGAPAATGKRKGGLSEQEFETLEGEPFDLDQSSAEFGTVGSEGDFDVFDAADEDFSESFETGESHAEFVAPVSTPTRGAVAAPEQDWGVPTFVGLVLSTLLLCVCGMMVFDLVRGMWAWNEPASFNSMLLKQISGMFGS